MAVSATRGREVGHEPAAPGAVGATRCGRGAVERREAEQRREVARDGGPVVVARGDGELEVGGGGVVRRAPRQHRRRALAARVLRPPPRHLLTGGEGGGGVLALEVSHDVGGVALEPHHGAVRRQKIDGRCRLDDASAARDHVPRRQRSARRQRARQHSGLAGAEVGPAAAAIRGGVALHVFLDAVPQLQLQLLVEINEPCIHIKHTSSDDIDGQAKHSQAGG
jgi:hypothetical protein